MELPQTIRELRVEYTGLNPPASADELSALEQAFGSLPSDISALYRDHNGSNSLPKGTTKRCTARLMPVDEAVAAKSDLAHYLSRVPSIGSVAWLWTDDNSNYCGVFIEGKLRGWLCVLDHEEPRPTPAFRSTTSFLAHLLMAARETDENRTAFDIPSISPDIPEAGAHAETTQQDLRLAEYFREQYRSQSDPNIRRLLGLCSICLTPFEFTDEVMPFLEDWDMWIPEAAVRLLEVRNWRNGINQLEILARDGKPNGDSAAMRMLARMDTDESRGAIARLKSTLQGQKLQVLEMWTSGRLRLQPPRW